MRRLSVEVEARTLRGSAIVGRGRALIYVVLEHSHSLYTRVLSCRRPRLNVK